MKKFISIALILLILVGAGAACKSKAKKIEEQLIASEWAAIFADGSTATFSFYENNTAVVGIGIFEQGFTNWHVNDKAQLVLEYPRYSTTITLIFDIESDGNSGFSCVLAEVVEDPTVTHETADAKNRYTTIRLTQK